MRDNKELNDTLNNADVCDCGLLCDGSCLGNDPTPGEDDWTHCHVPVICIFPGQLSSNLPKKAGETMFHHNLGIAVIQMETVKIDPVDLKGMPVLSQIEKEIAETGVCSVWNNNECHGVDDLGRCLSRGLDTCPTGAFSNLTTPGKCHACPDWMEGHCDGVDPENCGVYEPMCNECGSYLERDDSCTACDLENDAYNYQI